MYTDLLGIFHEQFANEILTFFRKLFEGFLVEIPVTFCHPFQYLYL